MSQREKSADYLSRQSVLLLSDAPEFSRNVVGRWQTERQVPEITTATSDVWEPENNGAYDLTIIGRIIHRRALILSTFSDASGKPAIYLAGEEDNIPNLRREYSHLLVIPQQDAWPNTLVLLASEVLRRMEAILRAHRAERMAMESMNHAALGRYMLEMRPNINNALTSVLGNADLLLLEPDDLMGGTRDQIQTIHTMALRLNEIMQRFSSLDLEMRAGEKTSQNETGEVLRPLAPKV